MNRIAINGFGRIGRMVFRRAIEKGMNVVAINASYPPETLAHLIQFDSVQGKFDKEVTYTEHSLWVEGKEIKLVNHRNPLELPWKELMIDLVIEATGKFRDFEGMEMHLKAGAKKVVLTAPAKGKGVPTFVFGVNEHTYQSDLHHIVSNASCTTNCLAPIVKVIHEHLMIVNGSMTTVHSYTNDQNNLDNPHKDLRRARGCAQSIIPTSTGATKAIAEIFPELNGKLNGLALRVPTPNVSLVDVVLNVEKSTSVTEVNDLLKRVSENELNGVLSYCSKPLVSIDFNGNPSSAIVDSLSTMVIDENTVKILAWYDNEWGYSCRVVDLVEYIIRK